MVIVEQLIIINSIILLIGISNIITTYAVSKLVIYIYLVFWLFALFVSTLNPFGLYEVSFKTYMLPLLGVALFTHGYLFSGKIFSN